jgi:hypothetical protein
MDDGVSGVTIQKGGDVMDSDLSGLIHPNHPYLNLARAHDAHQHRRTC